MLVSDHDEWERCDHDSQKHHSRAPCLQIYLDTNDGRDTRSAENEYDHPAVCLLKSGTIIGSIVVDNSQLELFSIAFPVSVSRSIREIDRSTSNSSHHENLHSFSPYCWICVDSISCLTALIKRMCLTTSNKTREEVCAYDKVCGYWFQISWWYITELLYMEIRTIKAPKLSPSQICYT